MESYELNIAAPPKRRDGKFQKGLVPFNKGVPMKKWMDGRKIKKVMKCLEIGRKLGNPKLAGLNKIAVVGIKDGKLYAFESATDAARILKAKGVAVCDRNIRACMRGRVYKNNGYEYVRKKAGGYRWFVADETEKYKHLLT